MSPKAIPSALVTYIFNKITYLYIKHLAHKGAYHKVG
jgi:hypothetical protein